MNEERKKPNRGLKTKYRRNLAAAYKLEIMRLRRENLKLKEQLNGGWISPDGQYCDTKYAARMINKKEQTLRNQRSSGGGPKAFSKSGSVYYLVDDLHAYIVEGEMDWSSDEG